MRLTRPFVLLALVALLAPRVEASRTSAWESNPPAPLTAARIDATSALASLAPAAAADVEITEAPRFDLGDVVLVESELEHADRFGLGPLDLLGPAPLRGPPSSYPKTRVRGFELLPPFRVGASPTLSLWSRQACGFSCREVASDSPEDPWGLQAAEGEEPVDPDWADAAGVWADTRARQERGLNAGKRAAGYVGQGLDVATDFAPGIGLAKIPQFFIEAYDRGGRDELKKMGLTVAVVTAIAAAVTHRRTSIPVAKATEEELSLARKSENLLAIEERNLGEQAAALEGKARRRPSGVPGDDFVPNPSAGPYKRGTETTPAQRAAVQGRPCVDCGGVAPRQVADHIDPEVVQHFRDGRVDVEAQRRLEAVQPHCPKCSAKQGGWLAQFARQMKKTLGL